MNNAMVMAAPPKNNTKPVKSKHNIGIKLYLQLRIIYDDVQRKLIVMCTRPPLYMLTPVFFSQWKLNNVILIWHKNANTENIVRML